METTHDLSYTEAVKLVNCSESKLRRKLSSEGLKLGVTKLKRGWIIPITSLEAMGLIDNVTSQKTSHDNKEDKSEIEELKLEISQLRTENAILHERCAQQERILSERERVVRLLEAPKKHWWQRMKDHSLNDNKRDALNSSNQ